MCDFCENIPVVEKWECFEDELYCENKGLAREKIVLVRYENKIRFYGFNKYHYEDDALYKNADARFCPLCGRKLSEETEKQNTDEIIAKLKENLTEDEQKKLNESVKAFSDGVNGLWEFARKGIENGIE